MELFVKVHFLFKQMHSIVYAKELNFYSHKVFCLWAKYNKQMNWRTLSMLFLAVLLIIGGLLIINAIYAYHTKHIDADFLFTLWCYIKFMPFFLTASMMIGYGVKYLAKIVDNLTLSLILSKGIEILVSVAIGYIFLKEIPNWRTGVGITIILIGFWILKGK
jgi:drug/metabolite transporter (DMT)-like permease